MDETVAEMDRLLFENLQKSDTDQALSSACRSCLAPDAHRADEALVGDMLECVQVRIIDEDGLPAGLCAECRIELRAAKHFRTRCLRAEALLEKFRTNAIYVKKEEPEEELPEETEATEGRTAIDDNEDCEVEKKESTERPACATCGKRLASRRSLAQHAARAHGAAGGRKRAEAAVAGCRVTGWGRERRFNCVECAYATPCKTNFVYHARVHTGERPHACDACPARFAQLGSLNVHRRVHSDETHHTCATCGKQFKHRRAFEAHRRVHDENNRFVCDLCRKELRSKATLVGHLNRHYGVRNFSCETCGAHFVTRVELLNHARRHAAVKRYACHVCGLGFHFRNKLARHLARHAGERPFACDACEAACHSRADLKRHKLRHAADKNYACPLCEARFKHAGSVGAHVREIHGAKYGSTIDRRTVK